ncbi:helix-turn-helix domain-containing protein [Cellulophaga sp. HaHa_2_95]|uniref:helix-turn-helix domain-containing protein n=1 Tax=Cellulophaga sp. HaHa_2_95 TaxID=2745558 RepID=UPI001C4F5A49|nr:helix-turn-helix domain-containing protein [Cellulophaga sp. HaHa_2_95]QXP56212.1 helix-turn-helix domain-containing protein [Cellulophaga sp. HaHa_2_95]
MAKLTLNTFEQADFEKALDAALQRALKNLATPEKENPSKLLSRKDTAKFLCISLPTLHEWTKSGAIRAHRIGNRVLYKQGDINLALTIINHSNKIR